jgi:predicted nuclease of predicted toxin-antitoxin system
MSILVDQCVPRKFVRILKAWGYLVVTVTEHIPANSADTDVIQLAQQLDAVLLSIDLDFANVIDYPPDQYAGIVVLRYAIPDEEYLINSLQKMLDELYREQLRQTLVIVEPKRYRVRRAR